MAARKPGMILYHDKYAALAALNDHDFRRVIDALMHTSMTGEPVALDGYLGVIYGLMVGKLREDTATYERVTDARKEAGRRGAAVRWQNAQSREPEVKQSIANDGKRIFEIANDSKNANQNQTVTQTVTQTQTVTETGTITHTPPTPSKGDGETVCVRTPRWGEVVEYARMAGYTDVDETLARRYISAQAARGWLGTDGLPIRDWRSWFDSWYNRNIRAINRPQSNSDKIAALEAMKQQYMREEAAMNDQDGDSYFDTDNHGDVP